MNAGHPRVRRREQRAGTPAGRGSAVAACSGPHPASRIRSERNTRVNVEALRRRALAALAAALLCSAAAAQKPAPQEYEPKQFQPGKDVPWVPMPEHQLQRLLDMAKLAPQDVVMDLGSGDGRIVIAAAKRGARAIGVEFNPDLVALSRREAQKAGVAERVLFEEGDLFKADLSRASLITLFLLENVNIKLRPALLALKPGTRIAGNTFGLGDWKPDLSDNPDSCYLWCQLFVWIVPARAQGRWRTPQGDLVLSQQYQMVSGSLGDGTGAVAVSGKLEGDEIRFAAGDAEYRGRVNGAAIEGTVTTAGVGRPWRAER
ncbi:MAG: class I SAM-dependent methyltransferase [Burkholderiales bacterium]|nr:class I SAM-dependent methyltransferase [Burkholderiales bacterium]